MSERRQLHLVGIVGSLRAESFNRAVFVAGAGLLRDDVELVEIPLIEVPLYNGDVEAVGDPESVTVLKQQVEAADGLVVFTPEYNRSIPAVTKNAIDWLSRMHGDSPLSRAKVGIIGATPGGHDMTGVRDHLASSIGAVTSHLYATSLGIDGVAGKLTDGKLTDANTLADLEEWLTGFVNYVRA